MKVVIIDNKDSFTFNLAHYVQQFTDSVDVFRANEIDIKHYIFKTADSVISYISGGVTYDKFKTFSIKIVLGSASTAIIPKIKDMKAIALDF